LDLATGHKELFKEIALLDSAGVTSVEHVFVTPDGRAMTYCYRHNLSDLYVIAGLK
jgi:hypothetical protein